MNTYSCFIIDDEPLAIDVLVNYVNRLDQFETPATFTDPVKAFLAIKNDKPDLIFLDIKMPDFNGLEMVKSLKERPEIVITTAFREYAAEGFDLDVLDYLVKPIAFDRFLKAIDKFLLKQQPLHPVVDTLTMRADRKFVKLKIDDIIFIEGIKDYVKVVTKSGPVLTKRSIGAFLELLPVRGFLRVHKSFIVAQKHITAYTHSSIELGSYEVPIGRVYKELVLKELS